MYSVIEASIKVGVSTRAIQKRCKKDNIRKKSNKYLITEEHVNLWIEERKTNELANEPNELANELNELKGELVRLNEDLTKSEAENNNLKIELKSLKDNFKDAKQTDLEVEVLKIEIERLQDQLEASKTNLQIDLKKAIEIVTLEALKQDVTHKIFTNEEFNDIIGTIALSENQEDQINYLRTRIEKQDEALIKLAKQFEQRNYIEARDKGYGVD